MRPRNPVEDPVEVEPGKGTKSPKRTMNTLTLPHEMTVITDDRPVGFAGSTCDWASGCLCQGLQPGLCRARQGSEWPQMSWGAPEPQAGQPLFLPTV